MEKPGMQECRNEHLEERIHQQGTFASKGLFKKNTPTYFAQLVMRQEGRTVVRTTIKKRRCALSAGEKESWKTFLEPKQETLSRLAQLIITWHE